ncbi:HNH endonuclease signature motif containing protein [soil metagenome]
MFEGIAPGEFVTVVEESRRDDSAMHARRMTAIAGLLWHRTVEAEGIDDTDPGYALITGFARTVADVGAALNIAPAAASKLVSQAEALDTRLPKMLDLLARHQIDWADVTTIIARTDCIKATAMPAIDAALAAKITRWDCWSQTRLRNAVDAAIRKADPEGAKERRTTADTDRRVRMTASPNGMARVQVTISAPAGAMFMKRLADMATGVCPNDPRTRDQREVDAIEALGAGRFHLRCECGRDDCPIEEPEEPEDPSRSGRFVVNVVASAATLTGASNAPGYLDGYGVIDAEQVRDLADHGALLRPTSPDEDTADLLRHQPCAAQARWVRARSLTCSFPGCNRSAWRADLDHSVPFDHDNPLRGGWTRNANLDPKCRQHHRLKTFECGWQDKQFADGTIEWTSPSGRVYRSTPDGADLFDDIAGACDMAKPRRRNHRRDKARRTAQTRAGLQAKRIANTEVQRTNRARAWEIQQRQQRNRMRDTLFLFKGTPSTSPWCTWVNSPHEDEHIGADWKPPPPEDTSCDQEPPF